MLSRVADSIFWMSRYMERSTSVLRVVKTHYIASQDDMKGFDWNALIHMYVPERPAASEHFSAPGESLHYLILDKFNDASVYNNIVRARENARAIQDNITKEMWQCLNDYHHLVREPHIETHLSGGDPVTALDLLIRHSMLYHGMVDSTMARGEGFNFLNIGKFLERAIQTADLLRWKLLNEYDPSDSSDKNGWRYYLLSVSGYELYLKTYRGNGRPDLAVEQAVLNDAFPHSILYCLHQIRRYFERLRQDGSEEGYKQLDFRIGKLTNIVRYGDIRGNKAVLNDLLTTIHDELVAVANGLNQYYFGLNY